MWDTLPTAGCELPCSLKCLDNIYCKFLSSTYIHLFIQTHFWHLSFWGFAQTANTLLHLHGRTQMDPGGITEQQASASKGAPSTLTPQHLPTQLKSTEDIWKDPAKIYFPVQPRTNNTSLSLMWEGTHWAPGSQALHMLKEETFILLITTNEFIPSVSELSQAHWG